MGEQFEFGEFQLHRQRYELRHGTEVCALPRLAMEVLLLLVQSGGRLVTRDELAGALWPHAAPDDVQQSISTAINRIRQVLGDTPAEPRYLQTVIGKGYRFVAPVRKLAAAGERRAEVAGGGVGGGGADEADGGVTAPVSLQQLHAWYVAGSPVEVSALRLDGATTVLTVRGALRLGPGLKMLELELNKEVDRGAGALVLDLTEVPLIDSAGLGLLLHLLGKMGERGGHLRLCGVCDRVRELLRMTRTESLLPIDGDVGASLAALTRKPGDGGGRGSRT